MSAISLAIVGAGGMRGQNMSGLSDDERVEIHAVCDTDKGAAEEARDHLGATESYSCYDRMLERSDVDAVYIVTPDRWHAKHAAAALDDDIHVLSEVPAGTDLDGCEELVQSYAGSDAIYAMNEETAYLREMTLVNELVEEGLFGDVYYAEGEYIHDIRYLPHLTPWRRSGQLDRNGAFYSTHPLGPILLLWMEGDRITRLSCSGSGRHYTDAKGRPYGQEDTTYFHAKTAEGRSLRLRQDFISNRPHGGGEGRLWNYQLQGTKGCYESARSTVEPDKIWLEEFDDVITMDSDAAMTPADVDHGGRTWIPLEELEEGYLPDYWKNPPESIAESGHGGADYFARKDFVDAVVDDHPPSVDLYSALDLSLPGIICETSIRSGGEWMEVPDPRDW